MTRSWEDFSKQFEERASQGKEGRHNHFYSVDKPAKIGETTYTKLRILPRLTAEGEYRDFSVQLPRHQMNVDGQYKPVVCPDKFGMKSGNVCPICALKRSLDSLGDEYSPLARELRVQTRNYSYIITDPIDQHLQGENGPWVYTWDFSYSLWKRIWTISKTKQLIVDCPTNGCFLNLSCERQGKGRKDIRYDITDFNAEPIPEEYHCLFDPKTMIDNLEEHAEAMPIEMLHDIADRIDPRPKRARIGVLTAPSDAPPAPAPAPPVLAPPPAPPAPPVAAAAPPPPPTNGVQWHYSHNGSPPKKATASEIAKLMTTDPGGNHSVWGPGMDTWQNATTVDAILSAIETEGKGVSENPSPPGPPAIPQGLSY